jgi:hypothetical protein
MLVLLAVTDEVHVLIGVMNEKILVLKGESDGFHDKLLQLL